MKALIVAVCLLMVGCTTLTPAERIERRSEREARIAEHYDKYFAIKEACENNGNFIYVKWFGSAPLGCRRNNTCAPRSYDQYYCVSSVRVVP